MILLINSQHNQDNESHQTQSAITSTKSAAVNNAGPYAIVPAPTAVQQRLPQPARAPVIGQQQQVRPPIAPQLPTGIPSYSSQIEGLAVSQTVVNDVLIDLQTKVINETQQQYYDDSASGNYLGKKNIFLSFCFFFILIKMNFLEPLSPIYIRAPNPTIILRSDLHRLRSQLNARPPGKNNSKTNFQKKKKPFFSRRSSCSKYKSISSTKFSTSSATILSTRYSII